jgi:hypothetical protein
MNTNKPFALKAQASIKKLRVEPTDAEIERLFADLDAELANVKVGAGETAAEVIEHLDELDVAAGDS